ncbi:MAG: phospholipid/cholesterol/gamma-HCH transport system permease protein [Actinomycetota bacterium]|nr:phospholipid/cholesterol/gamma-HCH transport system permease protein [Actinomycetota bacterium]
MARPLRSLVTETGNMFAITLEAFRIMWKPPYPWREFIRQSWFIASVSMIPAVLVSIAFGATIALQVGNIARQLGAESQTGAAMVLAVVREAAPIVAALLIAGAGGSAMCADIGSRKIREEIDAMEVLGVNPIATLVVPRIWAAVFIAILLDGFVSVAGIAGGYFFNVVIQGGTSGAYLASFSLLAQVGDLVVALIKAGIFGLVAAMVAVYFGFYAKGGPKGVGDAVNRAVVVTFMLVFFVNFILTSLYFAVVPQKFG